MLMEMVTEATVGMGVEEMMAGMTVVMMAGMTVVMMGVEIAVEIVAVM
ncbi:MAG: hypothetical protein HN602_12075, partial [Gammaproteobacteria bacterium]|nr:hypothetical protein [Gammaproteobacteria bacterium]